MGIESIIETQDIETKSQEDSYITVQKASNDQRSPLEVLGDFLSEFNNIHDYKVSSRDNASFAYSSPSTTRTVSISYQLNSDLDVYTLSVIGREKSFEANDFTKPYSSENLSKEILKYLGTVFEVRKNKNNFSNKNNEDQNREQNQINKELKSEFTAKKKAWKTASQKKQKNVSQLWQDLIDFRDEHSHLNLKLPNVKH